MTSGARTIRIHGEDVPVAAEVRNIDALPAHAHADEMVEWLKARSRECPPCPTSLSTISRTNAAW